MTDFPEAPASNTFKVKSTNGFEHLFTMRDESVSELLKKIDKIEKVFQSARYATIVILSALGVALVAWIVYEYFHNLRKIPEPPGSFSIWANIELNIAFSSHCRAISSSSLLIIESFDWISY